MPPSFVERPDCRGVLAHAIDRRTLEYLGNIRSRRALARDPLYRSVASEVQRCLRGFDWDLQTATRRRPHRPGVVRAVTWNVERGKRFEPLLGLLQGHPELVGADLLLLTELDIGMGRSGNRHIPRELGRALGLDWVFANFHLVLAPGDSAERDHGVPNTQGLHGAALLSRFPIRRFAAVSLPERADKFHALEKRLGSKRALLVEVELPDGPATIVVVHLDPFASPRHRARQMRRVMQALDAFGGRRVLLGGDFNTNTYDLGTSVGLFVNVVHKLARYGFDGTVRHYMTPEHVFERRTFDVLRRAGLDIDPYTDPDRGSIYYDMTDPELIDKSLSYLPGPVVRWLERKLQPWGGIVPLRIDWFAGRGLRPVHATTIERPRYEGRRVSDHNPLVVDLEY